MRERLSRRAITEFGAATAVAAGMPMESPRVPTTGANVEPIQAPTGDSRSWRKTVARRTSLAAAGAVALTTFGVGSAAVAKEKPSIEPTGNGTAITAVTVDARTSSQPSTTDAITALPNLDLVSFDAAPPPAPAKDTHTKVREIKSGQTLGRIAHNDIEKGGVDDPTAVQTNAVVAVDKAVAGLKDADEIKAGAELTVVNGKTAARVANAVVGKDANATVNQLGKDLAVTVKKDGYDSKKTAQSAGALLAKLDVQVPTPKKDAAKDADIDKDKDQDKTKTQKDTKKDPFKGVQPFEPKLNANQMADMLKTATDYGVIQLDKLDKKGSNIWSEQKNDNDLNNAATNVAARSAVVFTKLFPDKNINRNGRFNEHRMKVDAKYAEISPELMPIIAGIANLNYDQMAVLQKKLSEDSFKRVLTLWKVNHRGNDKTSTSEEDRAAAETIVSTFGALDIAEVQKKFPEIADALEQLKGKDPKQIAAVLTSLSPAVLNELLTGGQLVTANS